VPQPSRSNTEPARAPEDEAERAASAGAGCLGHGTRVVGRDRRPASDRLERRQPEALVKRGDHQRRRVPVQVGAHHAAGADVAIPALAARSTSGALAGSVFDRNGWGTFVHQLRERTVRKS